MAEGGQFPVAGGGQFAWIFQSETRQRRLRLVAVGLGMIKWNTCGGEKSCRALLFMFYVIVVHVLRAKTVGKLLIIFLSDLLKLSILSLNS